ncbi:MAG: hypothetical protein LBU36_04185 [Clostridiales bacterium]|jgi:hypothetical protein|nr:hypothetical protein [Clostridiales bacterium]
MKNIFADGMSLGECRRFVEKSVEKTMERTNRKLVTFFIIGGVLLIAAVALTVFLVNKKRCDDWYDDYDDDYDDDDFNYDDDDDECGCADCKGE